MRVLAALAIVVVMALMGEIKPVSAAEQIPVTAIDVLIVPDAAMVVHAQASNARLLKAYPAGFKLDEAHQPHITLIQRFVRTDQLDNVYAAVGRVLARTEVSALKLEAIRNYYTPGGETGVAGILVKNTPELQKLQQDMIAAVSPFTVETGANFSPHVSTGVAPTGYLNGMMAEDFEPFTFWPAGVAIYQLGPFGTAARKLKGWDLAR